MYMWKEQNNKLYKKVICKDFSEAVAFINNVAVLAQKTDHHPTIHNALNIVELWLSTHDAGTVITSKDRDMAEQIDGLLLGNHKSEQVQLPVDGPVRLFADGGSRGNPGPSASGYVLIATDDTVIFRGGLYLGITTNNQAEYQALKLGLETAYDLGIREVAVHMDSLLVINQIKGTFKVKNIDLVPLHASICQLASQFAHVTYTHVPRALNTLADAEVNKVLDAQVNS